MERAILENRKTQTRRVITAANSTVDGWIWNSVRFSSLDLANPKLAEDCSYRSSCGCLKYASSSEDDDPTIGHRIRSRWCVGDLLWVRESIAVNAMNYAAMKTMKIAFDPLGIWYLADGTKPSWCDKTLTARFMPGWASRITLKITEVRVQRLQKISESDVMDKGAGATGPSHEEWDGDPDQYQKRFRELWDSINSKRGLDWVTNPWVWAISFEREQA